MAQFEIEVAYADKTEQSVQRIMVSESITVEESIKQSKLLEMFPQIDLAVNAVGIFGETVSLDTPVKEGDRVEIYRSLTMDPKEARRLRAKSPS